MEGKTNKLNVEKELKGELEYLLDKIKYHNENLHKETTTTEKADSEFKPQFPYRANYECGAIFETAKKVIDILVKIVILKETEIYEENISLQRFFLTLESGNIKTGKLYGVCNKCQNKYTEETKKCYKNILKTGDLTKMWLREYNSWIKKLIEIRTMNVHKFSLMSKTVEVFAIEMDGKRTTQQWDREIHGFANVVCGKMSCFPKAVLTPPK